jgi:hypothetical protein
MGRSYLFECPKCSYKTHAAGRAERGVHFSVQTILCQDCRQLYDAVTSLKIPEDADEKAVLPSRFKKRAPGQPPDFDAVVNRLALIPSKKPKWVRFKISCPITPSHQVEAWNDPGKCPRCGVFLEKNALPFRLWD